MSKTCCSYGSRPGTDASHCRNSTSSGDRRMNVCAGTGCGRICGPRPIAATRRQIHRGLIFGIDAKRAHDLRSFRRVDAIDEHDVRFVERDLLILDPDLPRRRIEAHAQADASLRNPCAANHGTRPAGHGSACATATARATAAALPNPARTAPPQDQQLERATPGRVDSAHIGRHDRRRHRSGAPCASSAMKGCANISAATRVSRIMLSSHSWKKSSGPPQAREKAGRLS